MTVGYTETMAGIAAFAARKEAAALALSMLYGTKCGIYAAMERRWDDKTGNARGGLYGGAQADGDGITVFCAHTMDYGVYLELKDSGNYAILGEAIMHGESAFRRELEILLNTI